MGRFSLPKKKDEYKISKETADAAVMELLGFYEIEIDELPDRDQQQAMEGVAAKLSRFYRMGLVENVRENGTLKIKQHLQNPPGDVRELTYDRMTGKFKLAMDGFKETEQNAKAQALMAALCGLPDGTMQKLVGNDLSAMECLSAVFRVG